MAETNIDFDTDDDYSEDNIYFSTYFKHQENKENFTFL